MVTMVTVKYIHNLLKNWHQWSSWNRVPTDIEQFSKTNIHYPGTYLVFPSSIKIGITNDWPCIIMYSKMMNVYWPIRAPHYCVEIRNNIHCIKIHRRCDFTVSSSLAVTVYLQTHGSVKHHISHICSYVMLFFYILNPILVNIIFRETLKIGFSLHVQEYA